MRMRMLLSALAAEADELDLLFFVSRDRCLEGDALADFQSELNARWGLRANVTLCPFADRTPQPNALWSQIAPILDARYQKRFVHSCEDDCVAALEACLEREPDLLFFHRLHSMSPVFSVRRALPPIVFDFDDVEHWTELRRIRTFRLSQAPSYLLRLPALHRLERRAIRLAHATFVCSERDRKYLTSWLRLPRVEVVPNAVEFPQALTASTPAMTVGYLGRYSYRPNIKAAEELIASIWPIVRAKVPEARLLLGGALAERIPSFRRAQADQGARRKRYAGIEFTGFVTDVTQFYERVQVICCPIRSGGGTRIKIIEAAAHGLPVVATRLAADGLDFTDGDEIVLADDPAAIAQACIDLLLDPARCRAIGAAARAKAAARYHRKDVIASLRKRLRSIAETSL
jgi:glycosyltransferase involved in cell wall biosynthesis